MSSFNFFGSNGAETLEESFSIIRDFYKKNGFIILKNNFLEIETPKIPKNKPLNEFLEELSEQDEYSGNWQPIHYFKNGFTIITEKFKDGVEVIKTKSKTPKSSKESYLCYCTRRINDNPTLEAYKEETKTKKAAFALAIEYAEKGFSVTVSLKSSPSEVIIKAKPKLKERQKKVPLYCFFGWQKENQY